MLKHNTMQNNHSKLLQVLVGEAGDYFIGTTAITTKKFSRIKITTEATLTELKIRGVSVVTDRNYGTLPVGHELVAGGDDYFDHVDLATGTAIGYIYSEESAVGSLAVDVEDGVAEAAMAPEVTFNNTGGSGSKLLHWQVRDDTDVVVQEGIQIVYFLKGTAVTVNLAGLTYFATPDTGYELDIWLDGSDTVTTSAPFEITAGE
jgi:hypothetical protein